MISLMAVDGNRVLVREDAVAFYAGRDDGAAVHFENTARAPLYVRDSLEAIGRGLGFDMGLAGVADKAPADDE